MKILYSLALLLMTLPVLGQNLINPYVFTASGTTLNNGLVVYYKLDEASGSRADSEPNGTSYTLTDNNTVGSTTGKIGNAASFIAAGNEYLSAADTDDLSFTSFTITCWVNFASTSSDRALVSKWTSTGNQREYLLYMNSSRIKLLVSANGSTSTAAIANTFGAPSNGVTYFVACGYNADTDLAWISINNGTVDSVSHTTGIFTGTSPFYIGIFSASFGAMDGWIDEVAVWNRSLSAGEISEVYNSNAGKTCCPIN
jgi:hypothetical protein